ncbi:transposase [Pantoea ananatis]|uniref:transposase n=1 Tax=Pantoea ananas TaxID=553 RepID=UPI003BFA70FE
MQSGTCVAELAREHSVNDNLVFNWRNLHRQGMLVPASRATLIPVTVEPLTPPSRHNGAVLSDQPPVISCKLTLPGGSVSLTGPLTPEQLGMLLEGINRNYPQRINLPGRCTEPT